VIFRLFKHNFLEKVRLFTNQLFKEDFRTTWTSEKGTVASQLLLRPRKATGLSASRFLTWSEQIAGLPGADGLNSDNSHAFVKPSSSLKQHQVVRLGDCFLLHCTLIDRISYEQGHYEIQDVGKNQVRRATR
jgi:hypothetical protein